MNEEQRFRSGLERSKIFYALAHNSLTSIEKEFSGKEVIILDYDSLNGHALLPLRGHKTYFKNFTDDGLHCTIEYFNGHKREECWYVPVDFITFKDNK